MADFVNRLDRYAHLQRVPRLFRDRSNPLEELRPAEVRERYRFCPETILSIVHMIHDEIAAKTRRSSPIPPLLMVLVTLQFYATGTHHVVIAALHGVSRPSVTRAVKRVTSALNALVRQHIVFPRGENLRDVQREFYSIAGFPQIVGAVDGTQIRIAAPRQDEADYVNRKGFHAINVQMICDAKFYITNVVARWPGSVHDSRIFRESAISDQFERGEIDGILLGDSGYACRRFLMTPYLNPQTQAHVRFNTALCQTRVLIEQTFGILKRRFPCLAYGLRTSPGQACQITIACAILHNFGLRQGDIYERFINEAIDLPDIQPPQGNETGRIFRDYLANTFFG